MSQIRFGLQLRICNKDNSRIEKGKPYLVLNNEYQISEAQFEDIIDFLKSNSAREVKNLNKDKKCCCGEKAEQVLKFKESNIRDIPLCQKCSFHIKNDYEKFNYLLENYYHNPKCGLCILDAHNFSSNIFYDDIEDEGIYNGGFLIFIPTKDVCFCTRFSNFDILINLLERECDSFGECQICSRKTKVFDLSKNCEVKDYYLCKDCMNEYHSCLKKFKEENLSWVVSNKI